MGSRSKTYRCSCDCRSAERRRLYLVNGGCRGQGKVAREGERCDACLYWGVKSAIRTACGPLPEMKPSEFISEFGYGQGPGDGISMMSALAAAYWRPGFSKTRFKQACQKVRTALGQRNLIRWEDRAIHTENEIVTLLESVGE